MNLYNSEEGQMIGMEDDIVKNEDLGRRSLMGRKRNNKRKMKGRKKKGKKGKRKEKKGKGRKKKEKKGKGRKNKGRKTKAKKGKGCKKGKPLSGNKGPKCSTNKDCGPYGLCNLSLSDYELGRKNQKMIERCTCYKTKKLRNKVLNASVSDPIFNVFRSGPLSSAARERHSLN